MTIFGQGCLTARRLVEAGSRFVSVFWDEYGLAGSAWDTHWEHYPRMRNELCPGFDRAMSGLITDLDSRGLLDETLVLCVSEHGRTPKISSAQGGGRDHWSRAYSTLLAGGGIARGKVVGKTDKIAGDVVERPVSPKDLLATTYHLLGIDPETTIQDRINRPMSLVPGGSVLTRRLWPDMHRCRTLLPAPLILLVLLGGKEPEGRPASPAKEWKPIPVKVEKTKAGFTLLRDGKPFLVKGVGGTGSLALLAKSGGNSVRTWGRKTWNASSMKPTKHRPGTVMAGIWLGHERHGFNYNDSDQVAKQYDDVRKIILRYRNHPALLAWGLGNEMEGYAKGDNAAIWSAINNLASLAHKLDPHHPTMTVVAEIGGDRVKNIHRLCPDIDIVGINSYGGAATLPKRYREAGGAKPYLLTEFGPSGTWEVKKNAWGSAPEPTSTAKAEHYRKTYREAVLGAKGMCLGSYAFLWGQKQEATATWFGMLLPNGNRLAAVDTMTELWSGKPPVNRCPSIRTLEVVGKDEVDPGASLEVRLSASDPEDDPLTVRWVLQRESAAFGVGGDDEEASPTSPSSILKGSLSGAKVQMPKDGGTYRLFAYVHDDHGGAAVGNVLLRVKGPIVLPKGKKATLPLVVYDESDQSKPPYAPTGWMGNTKATKMAPDCKDNPKSGKTCIRIDYSGTDGWAGIVWQHPSGDWGSRPGKGARNLTGAKKLTFWARGRDGGEAVSFEIGLLGKDKAFPDTSNSKLADVKLTKEWKQYSIDLAGKDLSRIKTGFSCTWSASGKPVTFFLDDVRYK